MSKHVFIIKEQLCQSFWQLVKAFRFEAKKIDGGGVRSTLHPPLEASRVKVQFAFAYCTRGFLSFVTKKYQTCLIFGLSVTSDKNTVNVPKTLENFVDSSCHE